MTRQINEFFWIYFHLQIQKNNYGYLFLRIISKAAKKIKIDVPIFLSNRQRLKLKKGELKEGQIIKGIQKNSENNNYLIHIWEKADNYSRAKKLFTKEQI